LNWYILLFFHFTRVAGDYLRTRPGDGMDASLLPDGEITEKGKIN
jgi:hypothetical protein